MGPKILFAGDDGMIYLSCPFCNANSLKYAKRYSLHEIVRIDCECGKSYEILIESRKAFRKKTFLPCTYWKQSDLDKFHNANISDLTLYGCNMITPDNPPPVQKNDYINLVFRLDDPDHTRIKRQAVVRRIKDNAVGCQFVNPPALDAKLGFYVEDFKVPDKEKR